MKGKEGKATVEKLISKFEADKSYYQSERYNETLLRSDFLDPLFESLGWDINNTSGLSISVLSNFELMPGYYQFFYEKSAG